MCPLDLLLPFYLKTTKFDMVERNTALDYQDTASHLEWDENHFTLNSLE